ncbi:hypothetical protein BKA64DRAFT_658924 [Cadophora sp. MPI-SDFR-AT-0126]|nr:hypothetical protein BKA64DRAFT_658924 [Leotiomycetes sp. MPI-SDFR-AT-0126]
MIPFLRRVSNLFVFSVSILYAKGQSHIFSRIADKPRTTAPVSERELSYHLTLVPYIRNDEFKPQNQQQRHSRPPRPICHYALPPRTGTNPRRQCQRFNLPARSSQHNREIHYHQLPRNSTYSGDRGLAGRPSDRVCHLRPRE